jgi:hypothetical protein
MAGQVIGEGETLEVIFLDFAFAHFQEDFEEGDVEHFRQSDVRDLGVVLGQVGMQPAVP